MADKTKDEQLLDEVGTIDASLDVVDNAVIDNAASTVGFEDPITMAVPELAPEFEDPYTLEESVSDLELDPESGIPNAALDAMGEQLKKERELDSANLKATGLGLARGLTLGLSDQAIVKSGLMTSEQLRELKEANPILSGAGELAGFVAPLITTGGVTGVAGAAVKGAGKAGQLTERMVAKALKDAVKTKAEKRLVNKIINKSLPKAAGSAVEGAAFGVGQVLSEDALGTAEANAENLIAGASLGAVTGGAVGGAFGAFSASIPIIKNASKSAKNAIKKSSDVETAALNWAGVSPIQSVKLKNLKPNVVKEFPNFLKDKAMQGKFKPDTTIYDNILRLKNDASNQIGKILKSADELASKNDELLIQESKIAREVIEDINEKYIKRYEDSVGFEQQLYPIRKYIRSWQKRFKSPKSLTPSKLHQLRRDVDDLIKHEKEPGKRPLIQEAYHDVRTLLSDRFKNIIRNAGGSVDEGASKLYDDLITANKDYEISATMLPYIEKKLEKDANKSIFDIFDILGASTGIEGFAFVQLRKYLQSDIRNKVLILSKVEKDANKVVNAIDSSTNKLLKFKTSGRDLFKAAAPTATKTLQGVTLSFENKEPPKNETRMDAFRRISNEIQDKIENPDKNLEKLLFRTTRLRAAAPKTADHIEKVAKTGIEFLYNKLPKPNLLKASIQPGLAKKQFTPSDVEISKFERYVRAVNSPLTVVEDMANGDITREGVEAIRVVYPDLYNRIRNTVMEKVSSSENPLNYSQRLQLGILLDLPTDESLVPQNIITLQSQFAPEEEQPAGPGSSGSNASGGAQGAVRSTVGGLKQLDAASRTEGGLTKVINR